MRRALRARGSSEQKSVQLARVLARVPVVPALPLSAAAAIIAAAADALVVVRGYRSVQLH